jgi:hypothetical protein
MTVCRSLSLAAASLLVLACALPAPAADRSYWRQESGHFENTDRNRWVERAPDGATYHFVEVERRQRYVELYDRSRDCTVRLFDDRYEVKAPWNNYRFENYGVGRWGGR